ncbi:MAG: adenylate kinase [Planctomycetes bacterium]|nr:adenylate kinase [Planctomycetota bacterium]
MSRIVFLGPPGAGKGTQAGRLAAALGVSHVSTGDMLRAASASGSEFGRQVKSILDSGALVPDAVMEGVVAERLRAPECRRGVVLDGYPRTVPQAFFLAGVFAGLDSRIDHAVLIEVPRRELTERMLRRSRGPDDTADVIARRIDDYRSKTAPLVDFYAARGVLRTVDGVGSMEEVYDRIANAAGVAR